MQEIPVWMVKGVKYVKYFARHSLDAGEKNCDLVEYNADVNPS